MHGQWEVLSGLTRISITKMSEQKRKEMIRPHLTQYFCSNIRQLRFLKEIYVNDAKARANFSPDHISDADLEVVGARAYESYFDTNLLCGTPEKCARLIDRLIEVGANEIACFVDFGLSLDLVLESLRRLDRLRFNYISSSAAD